MTVEQLIEKLREYAPYREVYIGWAPLAAVREAQQLGGTVKQTTPRVILVAR